MQSEAETVVAEFVEQVRLLSARCVNLALERDRARQEITTLKAEIQALKPVPPVAKAVAA